jgi:hypothetical protein
MNDQTPFQKLAVILNGQVMVTLARFCWRSSSCKPRVLRYAPPLSHWIVARPSFKLRITGAHPWLAPQLLRYSSSWSRDSKSEVGGTGKA